MLELGLDPLTVVAQCLPFWQAQTLSYALSKRLCETLSLSEAEVFARARALSLLLRWERKNWLGVAAVSNDALRNRLEKWRTRYFRQLVPPRAVETQAFGVALLVIKEARSAIGQEPLHDVFSLTGMSWLSPWSHLFSRRAGRNPTSRRCPSRYVLFVRSVERACP